MSPAKIEKVPFSKNIELGYRLWHFANMKLGGDRKAYNFRQLPSDLLSVLEKRYLSVQKLFDTQSIWTNIRYKATADPNIIVSFVPEETILSIIRRRNTATEEKPATKYAFGMQAIVQAENRYGVIFPVTERQKNPMWPKGAVIAFLGYVDACVHSNDLKISKIGYEISPDVSVSQLTDTTEDVWTKIENAFTNSEYQRNLRGYIGDVGVDAKLVR